VLLLSGVPATGKSTFGRWLEQRHGFTHVGIEADGLARFGLANAWAEVLGSPPTDVEPLVGALRGVGRPVILSWGFPLRCFPLVRSHRVVVRRRPGGCPSPFHPARNRLAR
jgi:hypothetical protein